MYVPHEESFYMVPDDEAEVPAEDLPDFVEEEDDDEDEEIEDDDDDDDDDQSNDDILED